MIKHLWRLNVQFMIIKVYKSMKNFPISNNVFQKLSSADKCICIWELLNLLQCIAVHLQHISQQSDLPIPPRKIFIFRAKLYIKTSLWTFVAFFYKLFLCAVYFLSLKRCAQLTCLSNIFLLHSEIRRSTFPEKIASEYTSTFYTSFIWWSFDL